MLTGSPPAVSSDSDGRYFAWLMVGYPIAWAVGLGPVIFMIAAVPMIYWLIRHRPIRLPKGTVFFLVFLIMVAGSAVQLTSLGRSALYVMRAAWYVCAFIAFVYLANQRGPTLKRNLVRALIGLWALIVVGGYGAILAPELSWRAPFSALLPTLIAEDEFVADLINPRMAEIQSFPWEHVVLYRPAAPFPYTNAWGSSFALLFPFLLAAWYDRSVGLSRWLLAVLAGVGMVPFYVALNRGAWASLGFGLIYGFVRWSWINRNLVPLASMAIVVAMALPLSVVTGVAATAQERLAARTEASDETRASIYIETTTQSLSSPLIGFATPRPNPANPTGPPLGTHGQLWAVMFAHGIVAMVAYAMIFVRGFLFATGSGPVAHWAKVSLFIGILQLPIYGHLPLQIFILVAAVIMASWEDRWWRPRWMMRNRRIRVPVPEPAAVPR